MINVREILYEVCESDAVYEDDYDLIENEIMDSFAIIDFISRLEDEGIVIQLTQIDRTRLSTPKKIEELVAEYSKDKAIL